MKISITDNGSGIAAQLAKAIGAEVNGRFIHISKSKGAGYITGFNWDGEIRMMIRNYHLIEDITIERTNELADQQEDVVFLLSGIFPLTSNPNGSLVLEKANILICRHAVSSVMAMPRDTLFGSVTIAVSKKHLNQLFGHIRHPVVSTVLAAQDNLVFESRVSAQIIQTAAEMLGQPVPDCLEKQYYKLKCEELLTHTFAQLMQREIIPAAGLHIADIKAIYAIKLSLQSRFTEQPDIAKLAETANMSQPKLRKLFRQIFGKGVFEYYQWARMQEAARLLSEQKLTVSEVGYQLNFINLSHFTKVFQKHFGINPKRYAMVNS
ncbi:helix-turn-helix transcriptional regulator [Mucilaginibacter lacusdianchii]|uniref:helix-turn-helix transcriptional regulator n=1 Tax=Mucilaginibacter lacusdianchii TaxID=2684211 RepID=UPI00131A8828|nr:AraC family transcriptional regulator [Mucilaginibacter sp. JXJ CY 39]